MSTSTGLFDSAEFLDSAEAIAVYAEEMLAETDPVLIRHAVGVVTRAHGLLRLATETGLPRDAIVDALADDGPQALETLRTALVATSRASARQAA